MALRCLLFCSDEGAIPLISKVLADLHIDAEHCPDSFTATERVTSQMFQIVILDWDDQPEAGLLLSTARTRKAQERPLTLAIVGDDAGVPEALQAGANSILRKPLVPNQVRDIITTARDLLRAKLDQSASTFKTQAAKASLNATAAAEILREKPTLHAGEFLQTTPPPPGAQFITESDVDASLSQLLNPEELDPLAELEPVAATFESRKEKENLKHASSAVLESQNRGLAWRLKTRTQPVFAPSNTASGTDHALKNTELLSYDQTPTAPISIQADAPAFVTSSSYRPSPITGLQDFSTDQKNDGEVESKLFAYMHGEKPESAPSSASVQSFWNRRRVTALALVTSAVAVTVWWVVPSDTWNPQIRRVSGQIAATLHSWVNPQPVTPAQAPTSHENFRRASDEYKLPVAEAIPDATTDPSQIRVLPVVDPTVKQPNTPAASPLEPLPAEATPAPAVGDQRTASAVADNLAPAVVPTSVVPAQTQPQPAVTSIPFKPDSAPIAPRPSPPHYTAVNVGIPSSLRSQIASMTPEASGNKPPEAAMATFEPVSLPEATMKNLLLQQTTPLYPESAKGQSGTVVLQVLIGRDGTVQDAKFLQGSLLFARSAIDAVRQWRFQPYMMNGRPVSTTSALTVTFKPST